MKDAFGSILVVAGLMLFVMGIANAQSLSSSLLLFFQGVPVDKTMWFLMAGVGISATGGTLLTRRTLMRTE